MSRCKRDALAAELTGRLVRVAGFQPAISCSQGRRFGLASYTRSIKMVSPSGLEPEGLRLGGGVPVLSAVAGNWRACGGLNPDFRIDNPPSCRWRTRPNWWGQR